VTCCFLGGFVPAEIVVAVGEVYVFFVEDGCPLKGCSMQNLTSRTMAEFSIERLLSTELVLDAPAVAAAFVEGLEVWIVVVNFVRDAKFPFVVLAFYFFVLAALRLSFVFLGLRGCHFGECRADECSIAEWVDQRS